jgi:hypothetical protein
MKTPENFNHNPNVGLTAMAANHSFMDESVLDFAKQPVGVTSMGKTSGGKVNKGVLDHMPNDIGGHDMGK